MTKIFATTTLLAALGTSAMAQGIAPVTPVPETDVTVGTLLGGNEGILVPLLTAVFIIAATTDSTDGTN